MKHYISPSPDILKALETVPGMLLILSPALHILTASEDYLSTTGRIRENIQGKYIFDIFPDNPDLLEADGVRNLRASLLDVVEKRSPNAMEVQRYDLQDAISPEKFSERYWDIRHSPILNEEGEISYIIQTVIDITQQVLREHELEKSNEDKTDSQREIKQLNSERLEISEKLREMNLHLEALVESRTKALEISERRYRNLIEHSPVAMQVFRGDDMRFEVVNESMLKFLGKTADIIGKTLFEGVPEIVGQPIVDVLYGVYKTGIPLELNAEEVILERDGIREVGYYDVIYRPLFDQQKITGVLGIAIDVTHQIRAQRSIVESEARFRTMAEASEILISTNNEEGQLTFINQAWTNLAGWLPERVMDIEWGEFIHPDDRDEVLKLYNESIRNQTAFDNEFRLLNKDKNYRWLRIKGSPRFGADHTFMGHICSTIDVTEEKQRMLEIEYINKALLSANERQTLANQELLEANVKLTESEENLQSAFNAGELGSCSLDLKTGKAELSSRYRSLYGLPLEGEISWDMVIDAVEPEFLDEIGEVVNQAIQFGTPVDSTYAIRHLVSGERRWMRVVGKVRKGEDGNYDHVYAVVMDVTAQKEDEQIKNDFIAMVSHELKTPITSVNGYLQLLQRKAKVDGAEMSDILLEKMQRQLNKMTTMINGFLNVSRLESGRIQMESKSFDLAQLIDEVQEEFAAIVSSHQISFLPVQQTFVHGDRDKIGHVMNNLISNAVKYSANNSSIKVSCAISQDEIKFSVIDQGIGIPKEDIPRLFDRYYRVRNSYTPTIAGFGIGLYLSFEIIKRHGGRIWVENNDGPGSTFSFSIPLGTQQIS